MKGVILAGGTGTRLRPITHTGPKQLVPVANKPVLEYAIDDLVEAGIDEIGIILGNVGRREIQAHCGDGSKWDVDLTYIVQGEALGLAHAVGCAREFVDDDPFVVYLGDDLMQEGITPLVEDFDPQRHVAGIGLQEVEEPSRYGIVDVDDGGEVVQLVEKPDDPPSNLALIGIYVFTPSIFEHIEALEKSWRGEYEITEAIQGLLDGGGRIQSHVVEGWWKDTGRPEDVLHANRLVLDSMASTVEGTIEDPDAVHGRITVGPGSVIEDGATVRGPVSIGSDTRIGSEAYLGPYTSIGDDCSIERAHIEHSIVVGEAEVNTPNAIIDSLVGRKASILTNGHRKPDGHRLVVGENSMLEL